MTATSRKQRKCKDLGGEGLTSGWLALTRRATESVALQGPHGAESRALFTVLRAQPLTLRLSLPGVGVVDLALESDGAAFRLALRADRSIHILRTELA
jgi:hypothetical protein